MDESREDECAQQEQQNEVGRITLTSNPYFGIIDDPVIMGDIFPPSAQELEWYKKWAE